MKNSHEKARADFEAQSTADAHTLDTFAGQVDADYAFSSYVLNTICSAAKEKRDEPVPAKIENAAYCLMPHFGKGSDRDYGKIEKITKLLDKRFIQRSGDLIFAEPTSDPVSDIVANLEIYARTIRGTAFPSQSLARIILMRFCITSSDGWRFSEQMRPFRQMSWTYLDTIWTRGSILGRIGSGRKSPDTTARCK